MHRICRYIMMIITILYTCITISISLLLLPIFIVVIFSYKTGTWKEVYVRWNEIAFIGVDLLKDLLGDK